ncbi:MAG: potassium channel beta subunit family protein [Calditrichia bacterium]
MEYRYLGSSGLKVSALSFGAWVTFGDQIGEDMAYDLMSKAYEAGVNFFDNAEAYASGKAETIMGNVFKRAGWKRSDLVVSTKIYWGGSGPNDLGLSRKHIIEGTDAALERLQLDYVDLIYCHRPDLHTPIEETVRAMNHVIAQGKAFYWGTSEWSAEQIREACHIAERLNLIRPQMEQPQYNMFHRERFEKEYADLYDDIGLGTTIWSPLASGLLTGKYNNGIPEDARANMKGYEWIKKRIESPEGRANLAKVQNLAKVAEELNMSIAQLALAWCLTNPDVSTVITGASKVAQVEQNMQTIDMVDRLTPEVLGQIETILDNKPQPPQDLRG